MALLHSKPDQHVFRCSSRREKGNNRTKELMMATANQMMPRSGQSKRFSFHIETNDKATRITPRNVVEVSEPIVARKAFSYHSRRRSNAFSFFDCSSPRRRASLLVNHALTTPYFGVFSPSKFGYVSCLQKLRSCAVIQWNGIRSVEIFPDNSRIVVIVSGRHWAGIPIAPLLDRRPK